MASNPVAAKRTRRRPKPGRSSSLRRHFRSEPTCHPKTCNQNFSGRQKRSQQDDCRNQQYSIVALTNSTAGIVERYAYSAYGEPVFATGAGVVLTESAKDIQYTYTGREWDEGLGLYHFRGRVYNAQSGRFGGRDFMGYIDGNNMYCAYFQQRLNAVDPFGANTVSCVETNRTTTKMSKALGGYFGPYYGGHVSPNPIDGPYEHHSILCECYNKTVISENCTVTYNSIIERCIPFLYPSFPKKLTRSFQRTRVVETPTSRPTVPATIWIGGYSLIALPLPGNGGLGATYYSFWDESDRTLADGKCRIACGLP